MGRNKYPEIKESSILERSMMLFIEKGYEQTTLQDIADAIGMTRGAIYHHFKDKAEMVNAVMGYMFQKTVPFQEIKENKELPALEKIRQMIVYAVTADEQTDVYFPLSKSFINNPKLVAAYMDFTKNDLVEMFCELIEEGMEDGTIRVKEPNIIAELLSVILNMWISPIVFMDTKEDFKAKLRYASLMFDSIGLPVMNEEVAKAFEKIISALPDGQNKE